MRSAIAIFVLLTIGTPALAQSEVPPPPPPPPPEAVAGSVDPCTRIGCSGHGNCVVVGGGPTCACEDGYQPDAVNGLSCIVAAGTEKSGEHEATGEAEHLSELGQVEKALDGKELSDFYAEYEANPMDAKSFADYMYEEYRTRKSVAIAGIVVGAAGVAIGLVFYINFFTNLFESETGPYLGASIACFAVGGATIGLSTVAMRRNGRRMDKLDKLRFEERHKAQGMRFLGLAPQIGDNSLGVASGFEF
jgi:hypothetical protein